VKFEDEDKWGFSAEEIRLSNIFSDSKVDTRIEEEGAPEEDVVSHPNHYTSHPSGVECIDVTKHMTFCLGSATKYIWRADLKHDDGGIQDLRKAIQFIEFEIEKREGK
jgi:hypothetical protein